MAADGHSYERKADRALARDQVDEPDDGRGARAHLSLPEPHPAPDDPRVAGGASRTVDLCGVCGGELAAPAAIEESAKLGRTSEARRAEQALPPFTPERWTWSHRAAIKYVCKKESAHVSAGGAASWNVEERIGIPSGIPFQSNMTKYTGPIAPSQ